MRDSAFWNSNTHNGFLNLQVLATPRVELFATTSVNKADGAIDGLMFDPTILPGQPGGLDFIMQSKAMSGFSALKIRQFTQGAGVNIRLAGNVMLNTMVQYDDYDDGQPYLFDATGRHVSFLAGINWIF